MSDTPLAKGDRVRLNQTAIEAEIGRKKNRTRLGTAVGFCREGECIYVLWDGTNGVQPCEKSFLEKVVPS